MVAHTAFGLSRSMEIPPPSLNGGEGSPFPGLVPPNGTVKSKSVAGMKPGEWLSG